MNILAINGSPSANDSVTLRFVRYLEKMHPELSIDVENTGAQIRVYEDKPEKLAALMDKAASADLIIWFFPVYIYLVPYNLKRLIELIEERCPDALRGKYCFMLSTSIHFFDTLAHDYMHEIADDLGMKVLGAWSATAGDLLDEQHRAAYDLFINRILSDAESHVPTQRHHTPIVCTPLTYVSGCSPEKVQLRGKKVLILSDEHDGDNLSRMTARLRERLDGDVKFLNLHDMKINGGCLGCFHCTFDHQCVYGDKDDIKHIYNEEIPWADIVIYAGNIVDRFLSSRWKLFMDRRFMNNHTPFLPGKQLGVILSGPYGSCPVLHSFFRAEAEVNDGNLAGLVTDEASSSEELDAMLDRFCTDIVKKAEAGFKRPPCFEGIGGKKLFRDEMYGNLRFVFRADHDYYRTHGWYDFPQNDHKTMIKNRIAIAATSSDKVKDVIRKEMRKRMLEPYDHLLETLAIKKE